MRGKNIKSIMWFVTANIWAIINTLGPEPKGEFSPEIRGLAALIELTVYFVFLYLGAANATKD